MASHGSGPPSGVVRTPAETAASFEQMDAAAAPQLIERTPQRLSVGVRDAGLGWVEIRTRAAAGQITAVMATASPAAHQALAPVLPSIREYLTSQHVRVDRLTAESFPPSSGGSGDNGGSLGSPPESGSAHQDTRGERPLRDLRTVAASAEEVYDEQESIISVRA